MRVLAITLLLACASAVHGELENIRDYGNCKVATRLDMFDDAKQSFLIDCKNRTPRRTAYQIGVEAFSIFARPGEDYSLHVSLTSRRALRLDEGHRVKFRFDRGDVFEASFFGEGGALIHLFDANAISRILTDLASAKTVAVEVNRLYRSRIQLDGSREAVRDFVKRLERRLPKGAAPKVEL